MTKKMESMQFADFIQELERHHPSKWDRTYFFLSNSVSYIRRIPHKLKKALRGAYIGYNDEDFDFAYIFRTLRYKLQWTYNNIMSSSHTEIHPGRERALRHCIYMCKILEKDPDCMSDRNYDKSLWLFFSVLKANIRHWWS